MSKPRILTKENIVNIVIKRASGAKQIDIAKEYDSSVDRMLSIQKKNKHLIDIFDIQKEYFMLSDGECKTNKHVPLLIAKNDFVCHTIEITGNIEDGILCTNHLYVDNPCLENNDEKHIDPCSFSLNETDVGLLKHFKVGVVYAVDSSDDNMLNIEYLTKKQFAEMSKHVENDFKLSRFNSDYDFNLANCFVESVEIKTEENIEKSDDVLDEKLEKSYVWNASSKFISISFGRDVWNADSSHPNFSDALICLAQDKIQEALDLINEQKAVERYVKGNVVITNGQLFYKDYNLKNGIANRIISAMREKKDFEFFLPFLENLMLNPSQRAVNRLFDFLEANDIEITEDGHFIAWKKVGPKYFDLYTGKMDNSPGKTVEVPRNQVDEDDTKTCSQGLHVCSKSYLKEYAKGYDSKIVSVKVHPKDVVSIPVDYNNAKMRTCGYVVLEDKSNTF